MNPLLDPTMIAIFLLGAIIIAALLYSIFKDYLTTVHKGRLTLLLLILAFLGFLLLHACSRDFREAVNAGFLGWFREVPGLDIIFILVVLAALGGWAYKTWRTP